MLGLRWKGRQRLQQVLATIFDPRVKKSVRFGGFTIDEVPFGSSRGDEKVVDGVD